jgi:CRP-like cAMP-binding protein
LNRFSRPELILQLWPQTSHLDENDIIPALTDRLIRRIRRSLMEQCSLDNAVLSRLSGSDLARLEPLDPVELRQNDFIYRCGDSIEQVLFPRSGLVSMVLALAQGPAVETAVVGREGVLGSSVASGRTDAFSDARVLAAGRAWTVPRRRFLGALDHSPALRTLVACCEAAVLSQTQHAAACNATHPARARLCRWLLELRDRYEGEAIPATQQLLAEMLGVQRTTVVLAAKELQAAGAIRCRRGKVRILDRQRLESETCECHARLSRFRSWMSDPCAHQQAGWPATAAELLPGADEGLQLRTGPSAGEANASPGLASTIPLQAEPGAGA